MNNKSNSYVYNKGVSHSEELTKNYHLTLQFLSALRSILASFS